jgi:hypothetical protein
MTEDKLTVQGSALTDGRAAESDEKKDLLEIVAFIENNRDVKTWPSHLVKEAEMLFAKALIDDPARLEEMNSLVGLAQELPVAAVESAVAGSWPSFSQEFKEKMISELLKYNSPKGLTRQIAVAEKIAGMDQPAASRLIYSFVTGGKPMRDGSFWPKLSQEKKAMLQTRFFLSGGGWVFFDMPDEQVMRTLLAAFIETATDPQAIRYKKSKRPLYDFARWAVSLQESLKLDEGTRLEVRGRLRELAKELPEEWKKEIDALASELDGENILPPARVITPEEHPSSGDSTHDGAASASEQDSRDLTEPTAPPPFTGLTTGARSLLNERMPDDRDLTSALAVRLRDGIARRRTLINLLQEEINDGQVSLTLIERLSASLARLERDKADLEAELELARKQFKGLQSENVAHQAKISVLLGETDKARSVAESRGGQLETLCRELEQERAARAHDRRELEADAGRTVEVKLNGFKWKLGQSLRPVFDNKRSTDDQEPNPRLAEFLRHWFDELEAHLTAAGVTLKQDI